MFCLGRWCSVPRVNIQKNLVKFLHPVRSLLFGVGWKPTPEQDRRTPGISSSAGMFPATTQIWCHRRCFCQTFNTHCDITTATWGADCKLTVWWLYVTDYDDEFYGTKCTTSTMMKRVVQVKDEHMVGKLITIQEHHKNSSSQTRKVLFLLFRLTWPKPPGCRPAADVEGCSPARRWKVEHTSPSWQAGHTDWESWTERGCPLPAEGWNHKTQSKLLKVTWWVLLHIVCVGVFILWFLSH